MSLIHKVRTLVGALIHKPFMPRPEKGELDEGQAGQPAPGLGQRPHPTLKGPRPTR